MTHHNGGVSIINAKKIGPDAKKKIVDGKEVIKLCEMKPTVESKYRLKKWCELGQGQYALFVQRGALDAVEYYKEVNGDRRALMLSYELEWLKERFKSIT